MKPGFWKPPVQAGSFDSETRLYECFGSVTGPACEIVNNGTAVACNVSGGYGSGVICGICCAGPGAPPGCPETFLRKGEECVACKMTADPALGAWMPKLIALVVFNVCAVGALYFASATRRAPSVSRTHAR